MADGVVVSVWPGTLENARSIAVSSRSNVRASQVGTPVCFRFVLTCRRSLISSVVCVFLTRPCVSQDDESVSRKHSEPNQDLEQGKNFPEYLQGHVSKEDKCTPLQDPDPFYEDKQVRFSSVCRPLNVGAGLSIKAVVCLFF